jgi:hypothetical protein
MKDFLVMLIMTTTVVLAIKAADLVMQFAKVISGFSSAG